MPLSFRRPRGVLCTFAPYRISNPPMGSIGFPYLGNMALASSFALSLLT